MEWKRKQWWLISWYYSDSNVIQNFDHRILINILPHFILWNVLKVHSVDVCTLVPVLYDRLFKDGFAANGDTNETLGQI
jgi:hypothetical protein